METLTKKFDQKTINTLNIINNLCFDIQKKNIATVFVDYSGHVNILSIRLFPGDWNTEIDQITNISIDHVNLDNNYKPERISLLINYLQNCIIANKILIPFEQLIKLY